MDTCLVCGQAIEQRSERGRPRQYHEACGQFWRHLQTACQWLARIETLRAVERSPVRTTLIGMANRFPSNDKRDAGGRFARKED